MRLLFATVLLPILGVVSCGGDPPEFPHLPPSRNHQMRVIAKRLSEDPCASSFPLRVGGIVVPPVPLQPYDPEAIHRLYTIQELAIVELIIEVDGTVRDAKALKAPSPDVGREAEAMAKRWRFAPGMCRGKPIPVIFNVLVPYRDAS